MLDVECNIKNTCLNSNISMKTKFNFALIHPSKTLVSILTFSWMSICIKKEMRCGQNYSCNSFGGGTSARTLNQSIWKNGIKFIYTYLHHVRNITTIRSAKLGCITHHEKGKRKKKLYMFWILLPQAGIRPSGDNHKVSFSM